MDLWIDFWIHWFIYWFINLLIFPLLIQLFFDLFVYWFIDSCIGLLLRWFYCVIDSLVDLLVPIYSIFIYLHIHYVLLLYYYRPIDRFIDPFIFWYFCFWFVDVLVFYFICLLIYWFINSLIYWIIDLSNNYLVHSFLEFLFVHLFVNYTFTHLFIHSFTGFRSFDLLSDQLMDLLIFRMIVLLSCWMIGLSICWIIVTWFLFFLRLIGWMFLFPVFSFILFTYWLIDWFTSLLLVGLLKTMVHREVIEGPTSAYW